MDVYLDSPLVEGQAGNMVYKVVGQKDGGDWEFTNGMGIVFI